jgi:hypothetical protein
MTTARIYVDGPNLRVYSPFEAADAMRALPVRKWDTSAKCWRVPTAMLAEVEEALRPHAEAVEVANDPRAAWPRHALAAVPPDHRPELHRVLTAALQAAGDRDALLDLDAAYAEHAEVSA